MKVDNISCLKLPGFKAQISEQNTDKSIRDSQKKSIDKKKILYTMLGALAVAGTAIILINNAKKGKMKELDSLIDIPKKPVKEPNISSKPPEAEELKPSIEPKTNNSCDTPETEQIVSTQINNEVSQELKPVKITVIGEKPEFSPEALEQRAVNGAKKPDAWSFEDMKAYYESGCPTVEKFKGGVVYTYPEAQDGSQLFKTVYNNGDEKTLLTTLKGYTEILEDANGNMKSHRVINLKSNSAIEKKFNKGEVIEILSYDKKGRTKTIIDGDIKSSVFVGNDGSEVHKIYQKDSNGKFRCIKRETSITDKDGKDYSIKTVEYTEDGKYSKTTISEKLSGSNKQTVKTTIRDGKGNIVDEASITKGNDGSDGSKPAGKVLETWYLEYLELCKEFGLYPHSVAARSGAWQQFRELLMRKNDPEAYARYLRLEEYHSQYDTNAAIGVLRRDIENSGLNIDNLDLSNLAELSAGEIKFLIRHIKTGRIDITIEELQKMTADKIKTLLSQVKTAIKEEAKEAQRLRELESQRQEQQIMVYA